MTPGVVADASSTLDNAGLSLSCRQIKAVQGGPESGRNQADDGLHLNRLLTAAQGEARSLGQAKDVIEQTG